MFTSSGFRDGQLGAWSIYLFDTDMKNGDNIIRDKNMGV